MQPSATLVSNSYEFLHNFYSRVENDDRFVAQLLAEILCIRDDDFRVLFSDGGRLSSSELFTVICCIESLLIFSLSVCCSSSTIFT